MKTIASPPPTDAVANDGLIACQRPLVWAIRSALINLNSITTEQFALGADKPARDALAEAYRNATGHEWDD